MLSKNEAFAATKAAQLKVIEDQIQSTADKGGFETEILNLTEEEQEILNINGYKIIKDANKQGYVYKINWE